MCIPRIPLLLLTAFVCCQYTEAATFDNYPTRHYRLRTKRTINDIKEERLKQRQIQKEAELRAAEEAQQKAELEAKEAQRKAEREAREAEQEAERKRREEAEQKRLQEDRERWEAAERERKADVNSYAQAKMRAREMKARYDIPANNQSFDIRRETYLFTEKRYAEAYNKLDPNNKKVHEKISSEDGEKRECQTHTCRF